jgi:AraC-like DNA-binding protein
MKQNVNPAVFSLSKLDLNHFNKIAQDWKIDFIQFMPGMFSANLAQYLSDDFQLAYAKFNKTVKQEGISPEGVWTFAFVNEIKIYWRNYKVQPESIIIYAPGSEINVVSDANFEVMTFSISEDYLLEIAKELKMEEFFYSLRSIDLMVTKNLLWDELRKTIFNEINNQMQNLNPESDRVFKKSFTKKLLVLLKDSTVSNDKVSGKKRLKLLHDAEYFINQHITEPITVIDVASYLNVSERTLLYAFKNRFEIGPKGFTKVLKLNHVHHALHERKDISSIASIARDSGFWHMGQFYKDYKKFFGELPSDTFKKNFLKVNLE